MEVELKNKITDKMSEILDLLHKNSTDGIEFAKGEVPLLIKEYLNWCFWFDAVLLCVIPLLFVILFWTFRKTLSYRHSDEIKYNDSKQGEADFFLFVLVCSMVALSVTFVITAYNFSMVIFCPRYVAIEFLKSLIK